MAKNAMKHADDVPRDVKKAKDGIVKGKPFTQKQKKELIEANKELNDGVIKSELSGIELSPAQQSVKGVTPPSNEVQIDHIIPRSKGGTNTLDNAQVISRAENLAKSDKMPPLPKIDLQ